MTGINEIKAIALAYGACEKVSSISSINEALSLLMTPQGREFALKTGFPSYDICRKVRDKLPEDEDTRINGIHVLVDTVKTILHNEDCIAVGITNLTVDFNRPDKLHHVIAMHGAKVEIHASNYAVVTVTNINGDVKITTDGTAKVTVEQSEKGGAL